MSTYYEVLGVDPFCTDQKTIQKAYDAKSAEASSAKEKSALDKAYAILGDRETNEDYQTKLQTAENHLEGFHAAVDDMDIWTEKVLQKKGFPREVFERVEEFRGEVQLVRDICHLDSRELSDAISDLKASGEQTLRTMRHSASAKETTEGVQEKLKTVIDAFDKKATRATRLLEEFSEALRELHLLHKKQKFSKKKTPLRARRVNTTSNQTRRGVSRKSSSARSEEQNKKPKKA